MSLITIKRKEYASLKPYYRFAGVVILPNNEEQCTCYLAWCDSMQDEGSNQYRFVKGYFSIESIGDIKWELNRIMHNGDAMDLNEITQIFPQLFR